MEKYINLLPFTGSKMNSKENQVLELFYNYPTKNWHFKNLKKEISIADSKLASWLKKFQQQKLIRKIKKEGKMPYYVGNTEDNSFFIKKKLFILKEFLDKGFIQYLSNLNADIIIFGSIAKGDWHKESDIDIFIYGKIPDANIFQFESILKREIQLFNITSKKELKKFNPYLLKNILEGELITGNHNFLEVKVNA